MNLFASPWTWASAATPMSRPIATANSVAGDRAETDHGGGDPGMIADGAARQQREYQCEQRAGDRHDRPPAHPNELLPTGMFLHAHEETRSPEESAADFQVPSGIPPASQGAHAVRPQVRFHGPQPLVLVQPVLTPHRGGDGPERPRPPRAAPP